MILTNHGSIGYTGPSWAHLTGLLVTLPLPLLRMEDLGKAQLATRCKMWPDSRWQNLVRPLKFSINRKRICGKKNSSVPSHDACADAIVQDTMTTNDHSHHQLYWLLVHFPALTSFCKSPCNVVHNKCDPLWEYLEAALSHINIVSRWKLNLVILEHHAPPQIPTLPVLSIRLPRTLKTPLDYMEWRWYNIIQKRRKNIQVWVPPWSTPE